MFDTSVAVVYRPFPSAALNPRQRGGCSPLYPLLFGHSEERLYGVYHQPPAATERRGVVLCSPTGYEYPNTHRALRTLAEHLAKANLHTLRFDYFGTGNSAGQSEQAEITRWVEDVAAAVDELKASRELEIIDLVGLRFGATLAAIAGSQRTDVGAMVLWAPVVQGADYLAQLKKLHHLWLARELTLRPRAVQHATLQEAVGYLLTERMAQDLREIDLLQLDARPAERVLLIEEGEQQQSAQLLHFARHLEGLGADVKRLQLDGGRVWTRGVGLEQAQVPRLILRNITDWLGGSAG